MSTWFFALIVLLVGVGIALLIDRMRSRPGCGRESSERNKWMHLWFAGRFPTREEDERDRKACEEEARRKKGS